MTRYPKVIEIVVSYMDLGEGEVWLDPTLAKAQIEEHILEPLRRAGVPFLTTEEVEGDEAQTIVTTLADNPVITSESWCEIGDAWEENPETQGLQCVWIDSGDEVDEERAAKLQAQALGTSVLRFVPEKFHGELGVILPKDDDPYAPSEGRVAVNDSLLHHMERGDAVWEGQAEVRITDGLSEWDRVLWFFDAESGLWHGWECDILCGADAHWEILHPEAPDHIAEAPKDAAEFFPNPVFDGVDLQMFMKLVSTIMWVGPAKTPEEFAVVVADRPYRSWDGCSTFSAIPTPSNKWGWVYQTLSGRQLIWVPEENRVYTRDMRLSQIFRENLEEMMGEPTKREEPCWLNAALTLELVVDRPCILEYSTEPTPADNRLFFSAIGRKPFAVFEGLDEEPLDPELSDDFPQGEAYFRELEAYEAWQTIRQAAAG